MILVPILFVAERWAKVQGCLGVLLGKNVWVGGFLLFSCYSSVWTSIRELSFFIYFILFFLGRELSFLLMKYMFKQMELSPFA